MRHMGELTSHSPNNDPSGLFSTYQSQPIDQPIVVKPQVAQKDEITPQKIDPLITPPRSFAWSKFEISAQYIFKMFEVLVNGFIKLVKILLWGVIGFSWIFIVALATNTWNQAVEVINSSILEKIWANFTLSQATNTRDEKDKKDIQSDSLTQINKNDSAISETAIAKRRAVLEARKLAKELEEKENAISKM